MTQERRRGLTGPLALSIGGCITTFPLLSFFYLLNEGRLSFPYDEALIGMLLFVMFMVFAGLFTAAVGLQIILEDSQRNA